MQGMLQKMKGLTRKSEYSPAGSDPFKATYRIQESKSGIKSSNHSSKRFDIVGEDKEMALGQPQTVYPLLEMRQMNLGERQSIWIYIHLTTIN